MHTTVRKNPHRIYFQVNYIRRHTIPSQTLHPVYWNHQHSLTCRQHFGVLLLLLKNSIRWQQNYLKETLCGALQSREKLQHLFKTHKLWKWQTEERDHHCGMMACLVLINGSNWPASPKKDMQFWLFQLMRNHKARLNKMSSLLPLSKTARPSRWGKN